MMRYLLLILVTFITGCDGEYRYQINKQLDWATEECERSNDFSSQPCQYESYLINELEKIND